MPALLRFRHIAGSLAAVRVIFLALSLAPGLWCGTAMAQNAPLDIDPPEINLETVDQGVRGEAQVFTATITDNVAVTEATLHFRLASDTVYVARPMKALAGSSIYRATVSADEVANAESIQYYVTAEDVGGNQVLRGLEFNPLVRELVEPPVLQPPPVAEAPKTDGGMSTQRKLVYGALAVLAVGALAAAASGSDDGSSGGSQGPDIPLTITVDPLQ